ncbi:MAG: choice-of-anchor B family protein [Bacteroidetes bacterium]|nr:choice-of-anchor B family protein [Bacteroidota bacterium]HET6244868.1 choice-of-anchor B family protein [Bacteroidia bacterium]
MIKKATFVLFLILLSSIALKAQYDSENISLYSVWKDSSITHTATAVNYNSVWGYFDAIKNKEYAIFGGNNGTYFVDVTNPSSPVLRDFVPGKRGDCIWREYKNYGKYIYMISDDTQPNSFQIADMSFLPDSVHVVFDSDSIFATAHTLFVDKNNLYCANVNSLPSTYSSMSVYDLSDPEKPLLLRSLITDDPDVAMVHDMFVRNDTVYVSAGFYGLHVYNFLPNNTLNKLGSITSYPDAGYNHSSWLTEDGRTMVFCDEVPKNMAVKVIDVSDLSDIKVQSTFKSNEGATAHNPYIIGNNVVISYYEDGVQIFNITDPQAPYKSGYFDTHPQNGNSYASGNTYNGCWGAYPYLPSGILLASDRQNGLFILNAEQAVSSSKTITQNLDVTIAPNPFDNTIKVQLPNGNGNCIFSVYDLTGRTIYFKEVNLSGNTTFDINFENEIPSGIYFLKIKGEGIEKTEKIIKL